VRFITTEWARSAPSSIQRRSGRMPRARDDVQPQVYFSATSVISATGSTLADGRRPVALSTLGLL